MAPETITAAPLYDNQSAAAGIRMDRGPLDYSRHDDHGMWLRQQLTQVQTRTYDARYYELVFRKLIPPMRERLSPGMLSVVFSSVEAAGEAPIVSSADQDVVEIAVSATPYERPVRWTALAYGYSDMEIDHARYARTDLQLKKASFCRRGIEERLEQVACFGAPKYGITYGILNSPSVTTLGPITETFAATDDADLILKQIGSMVNTITESTGGRIRPNTLLLPPAAYTALTVKRIPHTAVTLLQYLKDNHPYLDVIEGWHRLTGASKDGTQDRAILYTRDPDFLELIEPSPFQQRPPRQTSLGVSIVCTASTGGAVVHYPDTIVYLDGV